MTWKFALISCAVGVVDGVGSALTGTSGPVVLLPILFFLTSVLDDYDWPVKAALGAAQLVQVPIALFASAGNILLGSSVSYLLALSLAIGLCIGVPFGVSWSRKMSGRTLKSLVLACLILSSAGMTAKLVVEQQ